jgi:hypothetical protein
MAAVQSKTSNNDVRSPSYLNATGGYILGKSPHGLCNRLRTLTGVLVSAELLKIPNVVFVWNIIPETPNHFLDIFLPVSNLHFINETELDAYESYATFVSRNQDNGIPELASSNARKGLEPDEVRFFERKYYSQFILRPELVAKVRIFTNSVPMFSDVIALHIRRTDFGVTTSDR